MAEPIPSKTERSNITLLLNEVHRLSERVLEVEKYKLEAEEKFSTAAKEIAELKSQIAGVQEQLEKLEALSSSLVDHVAGVVEP